ncbi:MAG: PaaI family thioesterase [Candidatus Thorarchaeota archaeon]|nr:PaaI family thioesterase [Candidatus Thorarchaeota archaeon]
MTLRPSFVGGRLRTVDGRFFGSLEDLTNGYAIIPVIIVRITKARMNNMIAKNIFHAGYESSSLIVNIEESLHTDVKERIRMPDDTIQDKWPEFASFCWGCGKNNKHGLQLKSYWKDDEAVATWTPKEYHLAFPGVLNGGIIATIIDCHGTGTANAAAHKNANSDYHFMHVTASLSVKFIRPTPMDQTVTLRARVKEASERRITVTCSLFSGDIECAIGEVVTISVDPEKFLK